MTVSLRDSGLLKTQAYVDGAFVDASEGGRYVVTDPADGSRLAEVALCTADDARRAIASAADALPEWRQRTGLERGAVLARFAALMETHEDDLAELLTREQGKPLTEARGEIAYARSFLEWFAAEAPRVYGETIPAPKPGRRILVLRQPVGVAACITPWNFPAAMITRKLGPALAVGCTVVVKPASATPLSALALAELAERAGVPRGVFHVLPCDGDNTKAVGDVLTTDPRVRKVSFTGSGKVGKMIAEKCSGTLKRVSLELGGNAPFLVFDDADLDEAVEGCMVAKFRNAGQTCVAANRILVHEAVHDAFVDRLAARVGALKVSPGLEEGAQVGPLIDEGGLEKVRRHVEDAEKHGARVLLGGKPHALGGTFYEPTILTGVTHQMLMTREETFGPVAGIGTFSSEEEAIRLANDTTEGLVGYFYARDVGRVFRVSEALEYGMVGVNTGLVSTAVAPFGGVKESGQGREGSRHGIDDWVEIKYVAVAGV